jgi:hypothetical protein
MAWEQLQQSRTETLDKQNEVERISVYYGMRCCNGETDGEMGVEMGPSVNEEVKIM